MNKMSKDKRDKLLLICIGAIGICSVLYFLVISDWNDEIAGITLKITGLQDKKNKSEQLLKRKADKEADLDVAKKTLTAKQEDMLRPGEDHVRVLNILNTRRVRYHLELDDIRTPEAVDPGVLPRFPFKAVALHVTMLGTYQDFGSFLADFENDYPYMRVQLLSITPETRVATGKAAAETNADEGKLRFDYRVIVLIRSQI